jgi:cinnamoyl-CoA reductase
MDAIMQEQVIEPAVKGTKNVMEACAEMGVKRVVFTSSIGAVYLDPHRNPLAIVGDDCWSNLDYCIQTSVFITFYGLNHYNQYI